MKVKGLDNKILLTHFILQDAEIARDIAGTHDWCEKTELNFEVSCNGINIPAKIFEDCLRSWLDSVEESVRVKYSAPEVDELVFEKAKELIQNSLGDLPFKLQELEERLDEYLL